MAITTINERWQALEGFVYSAFRMGDLVNGLSRRHKSYAAITAIILDARVSLLRCITFYVLTRQQQQTILLAEKMTENLRAQHIQLKK